MGAIIAVINKKGEDATETAVAMLKMLKHKSTEAFVIASPTTVKIEASVETLQNKSVNSPIVIGYVFSKIFTKDKLQPIKLDDATVVFEGRIYSPTIQISDEEIIAKKMHQNREEAVRNIIKETDGDFVLTVAEPKRLIVSRDVMGVRPLYYGENPNLVALTSERKALRKIGIQKANSFPPGYMALIYKDGFKFKAIKTIVYSKPKQITMQAASQKLQKLLQYSTKERISGVKEVAVAFSGGLDSSIIAFLAKKTGANVQLLHVSRENQPETEHAKKAADELRLSIHIYLYNERDVEKTLSKVLWTIEETDPVKASIGIPVYWAAERAAEMNLKVMLAGQGADELFGGYKRYGDYYLKYGGEKLHKTMFNDVVKMYETNFERDFKICKSHNIELRLPFATYQIAKFAANLPVKLKIELPDNGLRKLVLRRVAENLGLPEFILKKPKRAIQYTTGINKTLKKLAKKKGLPVQKYVQETFETVSKKMT